MSRLPDPTSNLHGQDLALFHDLAAKRGSVGDMYRTLLNHPTLTKHIADLGTYLRFESTLPGDLREFIILYSANKMNVEYEWEKHLEPAQRAGLKNEIIDAIKMNALFPEPYSKIALTINHVANLQDIPQSLQDELVKMISVKGLIELVVLVGFYRMIAGVITSFDVRLSFEKNQ